MKVGFLVVQVATLAFAGAAAAQTVEFVRVPLAGGDVRDLEYYRHEAGVVFAAVAGPGLYKSVDGGESFAPRALPGVRRHAPNAVLSSEHQPGVVLVCEPVFEGVTSSADNVFRSTDAGETFSAVLSLAGGQGCTAIAEGRTPGTFYAAGGATPNVDLYRSTDGGVTWTSARLVFSTTIGGSPRGISSLVELPSGRLVFALCDEPPDFYLAGSGGVGYSDDGVNVTLASGITTAAAYDLAFNGSTSLRLFTEGSSNPALWESPDGATFTALPFADGSPNYSPFIELSYVPERDAFLSLSGQRLLQSTTGPEGYNFDGGRSLSGYVASGNVAYTRTAAADPNEAQTWLVGTGEGGDGVLHRKGAVETWKVAAGVDSPMLERALFDAGTGFQYAAGHARVFFAAAGSASFRTVYRSSAYEDETITAVSHDLSDPKRIVIATSVEADLGVTAPHLRELADAVAAPADDYPGPHTAWVEAPLPRPAATLERIAALLVDGATRFVSYEIGGAGIIGESLYRSDDGGVSYRLLPLRTQGAALVLARDPANASVIYAGAGALAEPSEPGTKGLFKSTDRGESWVQVAPDPALATLEVSRIAFDSENPARFWISSTNAGADVWQTLDGGVTFTDITPAGVSLRINDVTYSTTLARVVMARDAGVFTRDPLGTGGWERLSELYGEPLALYPGGRGIATNAGLFVERALTGGGGSAGSSGTGGGAGTSGGSEGADGAESGDEAGGCGCRAVRSNYGTATYGALALLALTLHRRRRSLASRSFSPG